MVRKRREASIKKEMLPEKVLQRELRTRKQDMSGIVILYA
jgi:hypothetical protein